MAKTMIKIEDNIIVNVEWCSDEEPETETLKNCTGYSLAIGDVLKDGKFYRSGEEVFSNEEILRQQLLKLHKENAQLVSTLGEMVEATYEEDVKVMEDTE